MKKPLFCTGAMAFAAILVGLPFLTPAPAAQEAMPTVVWQTDWETARQKAVRENKPLFVRFRCFKMPADLAAVDAQIEKPAPGSPLEKLLAENVVPVRIGSLKGVDLNTFRFDYDLQLAGIMLDGRDSQTLARWGTRDAQSAASRISAQGLSAILAKTVTVYAARTPSSASTIKATALPPRTLDKAYPAFASTKRMTEPCWHCHYANDARIAREKAAGRLRKSALFMYPLPENVGLSLNKNAGNVVSEVRSGGAAQKAGVRVGDIIVRADEQPVYSAADLQRILNDISKRPLVLELRRVGTVESTVRAPVELAPGWRETEDISWRPSQGAVPPILGTWETPLTADERKDAKLPEIGLALRVSFVFAGEKWAASHGDLQVGDIIVGVNGQSPAIQTARQFHTWYRLNNTVGQTARFTVLRSGKQVVVPVQCVDVSL